MLDQTDASNHPNRAHLPPSIWTDEKIARLKEMRGGGQSYSAMSAELGFTRNAIAGKVLRLGLDKRERKPKRNDGGALARRLRSKGAANKDRAATQRIAKTLKVRSPSNGGAVMVESVVREQVPRRADFLGITLIDLEPQHCRFPSGGDDGVPIAFCGQPKTDGHSYCGAHLRIVYQPPRQRVARAYLPVGGSKPAVF